MHPPEPVLPPDAIIPPDPVQPLTIQLHGIINFTNGELVLNGVSALGQQVHVRGTVVLASSGAMTAGGELMFNPQPEPPRE